MAPPPSRFGPSDRRVLAVFWLALLAIPLAAPNDYAASLGVGFLINVILIASLDALVGQAGLVSLGHGGFFGLGAYVSGILSSRFGLSPWIGVPSAMVGVGLLATVVAIPTLRLRGHYLSMATLGCNAILVVLFTRLVGLTGGPNGLLGVQPWSIGPYALDTQARAFPVVWACAGLTVLALWNLADSRFGRALRAIAGSEVAAASLGVELASVKLKVFVLTAGMAGLAGGLYVHSNLYASPETFGFSSSVLLVATVAIGGRGSSWGPLLGAAVLTLLPEALRAFEESELFLFGAGMIAVLMFFPTGLSGAIGALRRRIARPST